MRMKRTALRQYHPNMDYDIQPTQRHLSRVLNPILVLDRMVSFFILHIVTSLLLFFLNDLFFS
jgi:hypothetical protein